MYLRYVRFGLYLLSPAKTSSGDLYSDPAHPSGRIPCQHNKRSQTASIDLCFPRAVLHIMIQNNFNIDLFCDLFLLW